MTSRFARRFLVCALLRPPSSSLQSREPQPARQRISQRCATGQHKRASDQPSVPPVCAALPSFVRPPGCSAPAATDKGTTSGRRCDKRSGAHTATTYASLKPLELLCSYLCTSLVGELLHNDLLRCKRGALILSTTPSHSSTPWCYTSAGLASCECKGSLPLQRGTRTAAWPRAHAFRPPRPPSRDTSSLQPALRGPRLRSASPPRTASFSRCHGPPFDALWEHTLHAVCGAASPTQRHSTAAALTVPISRSSASTCSVSPSPVSARIFRRRSSVAFMVACSVVTVGVTTGAGRCEHSSHTFRWAAASSAALLVGPSPAAEPRPSVADVDRASAWAEERNGAVSAG